MNISKENNYESITRNIRKAIMHNRGTMTRAELVEKLKSIGYETNVKKIIRLETDYNSDKSNLDFELIYNLFKILNLRFDPIFFPEEDKTEEKFTDRIPFFKDNPPDNDSKCKFFNSIYENTSFLKTLFQYKPEEPTLLSYWNKIYLNYYSSILPPTVAVIGNYAVGTTSFINLLLDNKLENSTHDIYSTNIKYFISSKLKPKYLSNEKNYEVYSHNDFTLEKIYYKEQVATKEDPENITVYFFDSPLLNKISLVECKTSSKLKNEILNESKHFCILSGKEIDFAVTEIINILNIFDKKYSKYSSMYKNRFEKINLIFSKQDYVINKDKLEMKRSLHDNQIINEISDIDNIKKLINDSISYDIFKPSTHNDIISLINNLLEYFDKNRNLSFCNLRFPSEFRYFFEFENTNDFLENIDKCWKSVETSLSNTLNSMEFETNFSKYLDDKFNENNSETISLIENCIPKIPNSNILHVTKTNLKTLADKLDDEIITYLINNLHIDYSSIVYLKCFESELLNSNPTIKGFLLEKYKHSFDEYAPDLSQSYKLLKNITGAMKPRPKSLIKRMNYNNEKNVITFWLDCIKEFNCNILKNFHNQHTAYKVFIDILQTQTNRDDLSKFKTLLKEYEITKTEILHEYTRLCSPDFYKILQISEGLN